MVLINHPLIIAHRGASGSVPENTLLSISLAGIQQSDLIEIDVQLTKDSEVVLFHDRDLSRITGDSNLIAELTLEEIKGLDVGSWMDSKFRDLRIPTLEETLNYMPGTQFIIEIKPVVRRDDRLLEQKVADLVKDYGQYGLGYISVRDELTYQWFTTHTNLRVGLMQKSRSVADMIELIKKNNITIIQTRTSSCTAKDYNLFADMEVDNFVYYADTPKDWSYLDTQPVSGVLTNYPGIMRAHYQTTDLSADERSFTV